MRESIGGISLTMIVIVLILLFAGIMSMTINKSNAIGVKDRIMRIIEEYDGFNVDNPLTTTYETECVGEDEICDILETINTYSYRQTGKCPEGSNVIGFKRNGNRVNSNEEAAFCIIKTSAGRDDVQKYYYKVVMFYGIDLPVLREILNFKAIGETKMLNG